MVSRRRTPELEFPHRDAVLDAMGRCRKVIGDVKFKLDFDSPTLAALEAVHKAIDEAATVITGSPEFYWAQGTAGQPGKPTWRDSGS